jgi:hypothetical protein
MTGDVSGAMAGDVSDAMAGDVSGMLTMSAINELKSAWITHRESLNLSAFETLPGELAIVGNLVWSVQFNYQVPMRSGHGD